MSTIPKRQTVKQPFMQCLRKAFGVPCDSHANLCLPFSILEDDEVNGLSKV